MIEGTVEQINSQPRGKYNNLAYSVKVGGTWYGWGFTAPTFGEGAYISFEEWYNGQYANAKPETLQVLEQGQPPQNNNNGGQQRQRPSGGSRGGNGGGNRRPAANPSGGAGGMSKDEYWTNKEKRDVRVQRQIQHQASRNSAIELIKVAVQADAIALPAKKADKLDALVALVNELTDQFNADTVAVGKGERHMDAAQQQPQEQQGDDDFNDDIPF